VVASIIASQHHKKNGIWYSVFGIRFRWKHHSITESQNHSITKKTVFSIQYSGFGPDGRNTESQHHRITESRNHRITESQHHKKNGIQYSVFGIRFRWKHHSIIASQNHKKNGIRYSVFGPDGRNTESQHHRITESQKKRYSVFSIRYSVPMEASQHHSITESQKKRYSVFSIRYSVPMEESQNHSITASQILYKIFSEF